MSKIVKTVLLLTMFLAACSTEGEDAAGTEGSFPEGEQIEETDGNEDVLSDGVSYFHYNSAEMVEDVSEYLEAEQQIADTRDIAGQYHATVNRQSDAVDFDWSLYREVLLDIHEDGRFTSYDFRYEDVTWDEENEQLLDARNIEYNRLKLEERSLTEEEIEHELEDEIEDYNKGNRFNYHYFDADDSLQLINLDEEVLDITDEVDIHTGYIIEEDGNYKLHRMERIQARPILNQEGEFVFNNVRNGGYASVDAEKRTNFYDIESNQEESVDFFGVDTFDTEIFQTTDFSKMPFEGAVGADGHLLSAYQIQTKLNEDLEERQTLVGVEEFRNAAAYYFYNQNEHFQSMKLMELYDLEEIITDPEELSELAGHTESGEPFTPEIAFELSKYHALKDNRNLELDRRDGIWE